MPPGRTAGAGRADVHRPARPDHPGVGAGPARAQPPLHASGRNGPSLARKIAQTGDRSSSSAWAGSASRSPSSSIATRASRCSASTTTPSVVQACAGRLTHVVQADSTDEEALRQLGGARVRPGGRRHRHRHRGQHPHRLGPAASFGVRDIWAKAISDVARPDPRPARRPPRRAARARHGQAGRAPGPRPHARLHRVRRRLRDRQDHVPRGHPARPPLGRVAASRSKYGVTIVGVKRAGQDFTYATPDTVVEEDDLIIVSGPQDKVERFSELP